MQRLWSGYSPKHHTSVQVACACAQYPLHIGAILNMEWQHNMGPSIRRFPMFGLIDRVPYTWFGHGWKLTMTSTSRAYANIKRESVALERTISRLTIQISITTDSTPAHSRSTTFLRSFSKKSIPSCISSPASLPSSSRLPRSQSQSTWTNAPS